MELRNQFRVQVPVERAWAALTDLERMAPCMPGFELQEVEGEEYRGVVKVKVGPMSAQYRGAACFQERDDANHRAVVRAEGKEMRGQGSAAATVTATLEPDGTATRVTMHTDLTVSGRVAQFGRGVLADVSRKLIDEFARSLEADLLRDSGEEEGREAHPEGAVPPDAPGPRRVEASNSEPVDLLAAAGTPVARRLVPLAAAGAAAIGLYLWC